MFHELLETPGEGTPEALYERLVAELAETVGAEGVSAVAASTGLDEETVAAIASDDPPTLELEEAAAVLAVRDGMPPADVIEVESRDAILIGMTNAVLDVEAVASGLGGELEPREIQAKVEGRFPMTLREFALLYQYVRSRGP